MGVLALSRTVPVPKFVVDTRLEEAGVLLLDEALASLLRALQGRTSLKAAFQATGLEEGTVRRWREDVRRVLGADPLRREGRRLVPSPTGAELLEEFQRKNAAVRVFLTAGLRVPLLAVDGIILYEGRLVAVKRRYEPYRDRFCLPGGIVEYGESVKVAVVREVREETGLDTRVVDLVGVYSDPQRDPRGHVISVAFLLEHLAGELVSGTDADEVALLDPENLPEMGFDHNRIVADYLRRRVAREE